jgi:cardiolipin synthase
MTTRAAWLLALCAPLLFGMTGCTAFPRLVPDLGTQPRAAVPLEGSHGPLSPARSQAILARLASRGEPTNIFDRHLAVEEAIVGSPLTAGNRVTLLQNGPATYEAMFAAIATARDHIHLETYILDDDEVGRRFADALIAKQQQGVQVNLIRDSVGTIRTPAAFFDRLNQRDHRKLLVVDGRSAILGGINISSVYSGGSFGRAKPAASEGVAAWRDTDLQLEGPVVAELQKLFLAAWRSQNGAPLAEKNWFPPPERAGNQVVRAIGSSPEEPFSLIYATLLSAIASAETSVHLTNAYFAPDPQLLDALEAAARRGVDVTLILPGQTDSWLVFHAGHASFDRLLAAGVKIFERRGVVLHSKTVLVDGVWATIGSTNIDWRSFLHNHELHAVVLGVEFGAQVQAMFDRDLAASDEITLAQWRARGLLPRLKEQFSRAWEYWL